MGDVAIRAENLGKQYRIGTKQARYKTLRESLTNSLMMPCRKIFRKNGGRDAAERTDLIWALKNVSFDIQQGEVIGVIGRNGAGKSTLLKILSRVTEPTEGYVEIHGRVGSLLEVGTGFHPELTGRENVFLNGAILGMKKNEIERKFHEIVAFAEVEQFLDTPVKRYSSGMYLRLAFSVAAHMEQEILLVDEVLAVGDAEFQKKCLGKMDDVAKAGRTVLFVSHNMAAVEALCNRCLLLVRGELKAVGRPSELITQYLIADTDAECSRKVLINHPGRGKDLQTIMTEVALSSESGAPTSSVRMGSDLSVRVNFTNESKPTSPVLGLVVKTLRGAPIFTVNNDFIRGYHFAPCSRGAITCHIERLPLMPGKYFLDLFFGDQYGNLDIVHEAISFEVLPADVFGAGQLPPPSGGPVFWPASWTVENVESGK